MTSDPRVDTICETVRTREGDVGLLVADEVSRLAPLDPPGQRAALAAAALARLRGLGDLEPLLADPGVDEVLVNAGRQIWVDRGDALSYVGELDGDLRHLIERILSPIGRRADATSPIVDARLPDRSRAVSYTHLTPPTNREV